MERTACSEVELVHAGNEYNQQQWRHAKPCVQIAEDQLFEAERQAEACLPPAALASAVATATPPASAPAAPAPQTVRLSANVVFNFDKFTAQEVRGQSRAELEALAQRLKEGVKVDAVKLVGSACCRTVAWKCS